jgi:hypothetical protein
VKESQEEKIWNSKRGRNLYSRIAPSRLLYLERSCLPFSCCGTNGVEVTLVSVVMDFKALDIVLTAPIFGMISCLAFLPIVFF